MKKRIFSLVIALILLNPLTSFAWDVSVNPGFSEGHTVMGVGVRKNLKKFWESSNGHFTFSAESTLDYWSTEKDAAIAVSPVLRYTFNKDLNPYIEYSTGLAMVTDTTIHGQNLGQAIQFRDHFGIGIKMNNFSIGLTYDHYSNAGLDTDNEGINKIGAVVFYHF